MKRIIFFTSLMMFVAITSAFACRIIVGQTYYYEWTITNVSTGEVLDSGSGTVVPQSDRGFRNVEHYIRNNNLGWRSWTRNVLGVRQRLTVTVEGCEDEA